MHPRRVGRILGLGGALFQGRCHPFQLRHFALAHVRFFRALNRLLQFRDLACGQGLRPRELIEVS